MNRKFGFEDEVRNKFKNKHRKIFPLISESFELLPLATVIDDKILVLHGGLFEQEKLTDTQKLELIGSDCFHPSHKGHALIFEKLKNFIETQAPDVLRP